MSGTGKRGDAGALQSGLESVGSLYAAGVWFVGSHVGELLKALESLGPYDEALIPVAADHGEEFLEHGQFLYDESYEETMRVPLLVKFSENRHAGE